MSEEQVPYDASDPKKVKERKNAAKFQSKEDDRALRMVMGTVEGRRVVWNLLARCGLFHGGWRGDGSVTFFHEGARNIGLQLLADVVRVDQAAYLQMQKEHMKEGTING